jgi:hypothetical protein
MKSKNDDSQNIATNNTQPMSRRAFIFGAVAGAVAESLVEDSTVKVFDKLFWETDAPMMPSGKRSNNPVDWICHIFGDLKYYSAYAGKDNRDYIETGFIHPNILSPFKKIAPLWEDRGLEVQFTPDYALPSFDHRQSLMLIGGPVSNIYSRLWQGYKQNPSTKIFENKTTYVKRRWLFEYNLNKSKENGPSRYFDGKIHRSWPQAIKDLKTNKLIRPIVDSSNDDLLVQDYLLINFIPNVFYKAGATNILDGSDLHGIGNTAFSDILNDPIRLKELNDLLIVNSIKPGEHFQALYRILVNHNHSSKKSKMHDYILYDVARIQA